MQSRLLTLTGILTLLLALAFAPPVAWADTSKTTIGVLANKGKLAAINSWQPLVDYLGEAIPEQKFVLLPLGYDELYPAVENAQVDFVITNPGQYIELESYYGFSRIATFRNAGPGGYYTLFGGVLFVRADRNDISAIRDLPGHKVLSADETSFGWLMQLREIKAQGVDPSQFAELRMTGNHEAVVTAILNGESDIGVVRTDTLERMAEAGKIDFSQVQIINEQNTPGFPFRHSTRLYPEWPFAKSAQTDNAIAQQVAIALLTLPADSPAAQAAQSGGWTIPEDYSTVHELFREMKLGPYQNLGEFSLTDVIEKYWPIMLLSALLLLVASGAAIRISIANRRLGTALNALHQTHTELEKTSGLLMESMQYARIIQKSLLPDPRAVSGDIAELAVLWEPLDMVGGDYYRIGRIGEKILIMVADCTGHGVPGAMLTMALSSALDYILHATELDPGRILTEIDREMRGRLHQDKLGSASDDGLEAAICIYDPDNSTLSFAGAGLPLIWVKNSNTALIKGDRAYLGYRTLRPKGPFVVHELKVETNMVFYMFTDGITGQVGGEPRQLFGRNRLMGLIAELNRLPLAEQLSAIKDHLHSYRQHENQRDDMTLIAFRLK